MKYVKWPILFLLLFLLQVKLSTFFNVPLNLLIILVYSYALKNLPTHPRKDIYQGQIEIIKVVLFGVLVGLFEDLLSESLIGPSIFSKGLIAFLTIQFFTGLFFRWTPILGAIFLSAMTLIDNIIIYELRSLFSYNTSGFFLIKTILSQVALNLPFGIIIKGKS